MKSQSTTDNWLSLEEAAAYIGTGKTMLYTLAREGRIPANKVGKKWTFEKTQLDLWVNVYSTNLDHHFHFISI